MPKKPHAPWSSPLWNHLEEMRSLRRGRRTWRAIVDDLGIKLTPAAARNFFVRATNPRQKRPIGWEVPLAVNQSVKASAPKPAAAQQAREAARKSRQDFQRKSQEPLIKPYQP